MDKLTGKEQEQLLDWLSAVWIPDGPTVCFVEGFSGIGKSHVARHLLEDSGRADRRAVMVNMPERSLSAIDDLLLDLAAELEPNGYREPAEAIDQGKDLMRAFENVLRHPVVVIIDEFQRAFPPGGGKPDPRLTGLLERLGRRYQEGRLLLISNRRVERKRWSEAYEIRTLRGLAPEEAEDLLDTLLTRAGRQEEVPPERRRGVVNALGCNPRAIKVLVASLGWEPLDALIAAHPELWEFEGHKISEDLVHRLETALLERTLERLDPATRSLLDALCIHRKPVIPSPDYS